MEDSKNNSLPEAVHVKQMIVDGSELAAFEVQHVTQANKTDFTLSELQGFVGGLVEIVELSGGLIMVVNEEFLSNGDRFNPIATEAAQQLTGREHFICGSVLICRTEQVR